MAAADAARGSGHRGEIYADLALVGILAEQPAALLSVPIDPPETGRLLDRLRRDPATPDRIRKLLNRKVSGRPQGLAQALHEECEAHGRSPDIVLTLLTRPHRLVYLPDGSLWLLAVVDDGSEHEDSERRIGWLRLRPPKPSEERIGGFIEELDVYSLPTGLLAVRDELTLIALQTRWKPRKSANERVLIVLGPAAAAHLGSDIEELEARAAIENVHLTVLAVPRISGDRPWTDARDQALELEGPVFSAAFTDEGGTQRLLEALRGRQGKPAAGHITALPRTRWLGSNDHARTVARGRGSPSRLTATESTADAHCGSCGDPLRNQGGVSRQD